MSSTPFATAARVTLVSGPAACGKTRRLVDEAVRLVGEGEPAERIAVFAATAPAATRMRALLEAARGDDAPAVTTPFEFELALLSRPEAQQATGRRGRVMLKYEENIFLEDMKTSGVQPRRLAQMLKFLYRSCADLEPMDYQWFYNDDEEDVYRLLGQLQDYFGCYVRQLVAPAAHRFAIDHPDLFAPLRIDHVLVDDYQTLSKASQCLLGLLARRSLTVAGDPTARVRSLEDYPCPDGLDELAAANASCDRVALDRSLQAQKPAEAVAALLSDEALGASAPPCAAEADGSFQLASFARPHDEFEGVADLVASWVARGMDPHRIAIATPKPLWERNLVRALQARGIAAAPIARPNIAGDVRTLDASFDGRVVTLLRLLADPDDQMALRCWCGFGDYLANSALFCDLSKAGVHLELGTTAIHADAGETVLFAQQRDRILAALDQARTMLGRIHGQRGAALVRAAAHEVDPSREAPALLVSLCAQLGDGCGAQAVLDALDRAVLLPRFQGEGVAVCAPEDLLGQRFDAVVLAGYVNGFSPASSYFDPTVVERDKRPAQLAREMAKAYAAAGRADGHLAVTGFAEAPLADAERLKLKIERVRLRDGVRVCEIHPSEAVRALTGVSFHD